MSVSVRLSVSLKGGHAAKGRVAAADLWRVIKEIQDSLHRVAYVTWTGRPSVAPSSMPEIVRAATGLELVAPPRRGSVRFSFELSRPNGPASLPLGVEPESAWGDESLESLGLDSLRTLIDGIRLASEVQEYRLPAGLDRRTLQSLARLGEARAAGEALVLRAEVGEYKAQAMLDKQSGELLRALTHEPLMSDAESVTGTLETPPTARTALLRTSDDAEVEIEGPESAIDALRQFGNETITVGGEALLMPSREAPVKLWLSRVRRADDRELSWDRVEAELLQLSGPARRSHRAIPRTAPPKLWADETEFDDFLATYEARRRRSQE